MFTYLFAIISRERHYLWVGLWIKRILISVNITLIKWGIFDSLGNELTIRSCYFPFNYLNFLFNSIVNRFSNGALLFESKRKNELAENVR